jgi:hypothetical protein
MLGEYMVLCRPSRGRRRAFSRHDVARVLGGAMSQNSLQFRRAGHYPSPAGLKQNPVTIDIILIKGLANDLPHPRRAALIPDRPN